MTKFIWHDGAWHQAVRVSRPAIFPSIIRDSMDAVLHPADGHLYDSKSLFRRVTADHGLVEMGNDAPMTRPAFEPAGVRDDIVQSIKKLEQGHIPEPVETVSTLDGAAIETRMIGE